MRRHFPSSVTVTTGTIDLLGIVSASQALGLTSALDELREIARGIHPSILTDGGLGPALKTLARRSPVPVSLSLRAEGRLPEHIEVSAYYIVAGALTNAAKHACASAVSVEIGADGDVQRQTGPRRRAQVTGRPAPAVSPSDR